MTQRDLNLLRDVSLFNHGGMVADKERGADQNVPRRRSIRQLNKQISNNLNEVMEHSNSLFPSAATGKNQPNQRFNLAQSTSPIAGNSR